MNQLCETLDIGQVVLAMSLKDLFYILLWRSFVLYICDFLGLKSNTSLYLA